MANPPGAITLIAQGAQTINPVKSYWWLLVAPASAMALTLMALNFLGDGLRDVLERVGEVPLVVRSSSLLEDRIGHAFSGKYKSLFIVNRGPIERRLSELEDAVADLTSD